MLGFMWTRVWLLWASSALATACVGAPEATYAGPERPLAEVALLQETPGVSVMEIDGARVSGYSFALLPGTHDFVLRVRISSQVPNVDWTIWSYCRVRLDAAAGQRYESVVRVQKEIAPNLSEKVTMEIGVAGADGEMRTLAHSCTGKRPSARK